MSNGPAKPKEAARFFGQSLGHQVVRYLGSKRKRDNDQSRQILIEQEPDEQQRAGHSASLGQKVECPDEQLSESKRKRLGKFIANQLRWPLGVQGGKKLIVILNIISIVILVCAQLMVRQVDSLPQSIATNNPHQYSNHITPPQPPPSPPQLNLNNVPHLAIDKNFWSLVYFPQTCSHPNHATNGPHYHHHTHLPNEPQHYHFNIEHLHHQIQQHLTQQQQQQQHSVEQNHHETKSNANSDDHDFGIILRRPSNNRKRPPTLNVDRPNWSTTTHQQTTQQQQQQHATQQQQRQHEIVQLRTLHDAPFETPPAVVFKHELNLFNGQNDEQFKTDDRKLEKNRQFLETNQQSNGNIDLKNEKSFGTKSIVIQNPPQTTANLQTTTNSLITTRQQSTILNQNDRSANSGAQLAFNLGQQTPIISTKTKTKTKTTTNSNNTTTTTTKTTNTNARTQTITPTRLKLDNERRSFENDFTVIQNETRFRKLNGNWNLDSKRNEKQNEKQQQQRKQKQIVVTTTTKTDIDECLDERACGKGAICENLPGSFKCSCPHGFTGDPAVECYGK